MHNNYHFLSHLSKELKSKILGLTLSDCYSQNKNELVLEFKDQQNAFYIKGHLLPDFCCLYFPDDFHRSKSNSITLFKEALNNKVIDVTLYKNERAFSLRLEYEYGLLFKMHGNRSNVIFHQQNNVLSLFKNNLSNDWDIAPNNLNRELDQSPNNFRNTQGDYKLLFPTFGKSIISRLDKNGYEKQNLEQRWNIINNLLQEMDKGVFHISFNEKYELSLLPSEKDVETHHSAISAINAFYLLFIKHHHLWKEKKGLISQLDKKIKQTENYISKTTQKLYEITKNTNHEIVANLLMANLHNVPNNTKQVTLDNFYNNTQIIIKINPRLSPQKNAENYYRKAKNQKIEIDSLKNTLNKKQSELIDFKSDLEQIQDSTSIQELRKIGKNNVNKPANKQPSKQLPYHKLIYDGYDILIGKNAKNNDILTQKIAHKNDLWLHAKDVSGSHVVIKNKPGHKTPKHIIEKAAQWAAYYSKRKTDSLCPVTVTEKKYVRKTKGLPAGAVIVDKEEVVLVTAERPTIQYPS